METMAWDRVVPLLLTVRDQWITGKKGCQDTLQVCNFFFVPWSVRVAMIQVYADYLVLQMCSVIVHATHIRCMVSCCICCEALEIAMAMLFSKRCFEATNVDLLHTKFFFPAWIYLDVVVH
jgi:hypothetical protein